jgi:hypothetical protein
MQTEPDSRAPRAFPSTRESLVHAVTSGDPGPEVAPGITGIVIG